MASPAVYANAKKDKSENDKWKANAQNFWNFGFCYVVGMIQSSVQQIMHWPWLSGSKYCTIRVDYIKVNAELGIIYAMIKPTELRYIYICSTNDPTSNTNIY